MRGFSIKLRIFSALHATVVVEAALFFNKVRELYLQQSFVRTITLISKNRIVCNEPIQNCRAQNRGMEHLPFLK